MTGEKKSLTEKYLPADLWKWFCNFNTLFVTLEIVELKFFFFI